MIYSSPAFTSDSPCCDNLGLSYSNSITPASIDPSLFDDNGGIGKSLTWYTTDMNEVGNEYTIEIIATPPYAQTV